MTVRQTAPLLTPSAQRHPFNVLWITLALLLAAMVLSWSSGFIGYRYVAEQGGVFLATFWRFVLAALVLLPFVIGDLRRLAWGNGLRQALTGLFAIAGYIAPIAKAIECGVAPGMTALIANLLPLMIVLMTAIYPGQRTRGWQWCGLSTCVLGMIIASGTGFELGTAARWAYSLPLTGVLSLVAATHYQKQRPSKMPPLLGLFIQVCASLPVFALLASYEGSLRPIATLGFGAGVVWLVVLSTLGGYGFYWLCLQRFSLQRISSALFLTPPVTMLWAHVQFGDALTSFSMAGMGLTLIGLWVFNRRVHPRHAT
ncbi:DMT family transporter [Pseudomonas sp. AB6]|uniref:DMT family transporter n=1 Tax=Pseudomonas sp. AB6 TaxID=3048598 RepID=UPI002AB35DAA|nr:DMT family transporter [Pseudomonas sp. AB6]MDY7560990.1 DMT family transporter [Pseudomonas sp. AB6]MEB0210156.1 DMT family transporter [Pseudomonas sp. AB6]